MLSKWRCEERGFAKAELCVDFWQESKAIWLKEKENFCCFFVLTQCGRIKNKNTMLSTKAENREKRRETRVIFNVNINKQTYKQVVLPTHPGSSC